MKAQGENGHLLFFTQLLMAKMFGAVCGKHSYRMSKAEKVHYLAQKHTPGNRNSNFTRKKTFNRILNIMWWKANKISEKLFPNDFHQRKETKTTENRAHRAAFALVLWQKDTQIQLHLFSVSSNYHQFFNYCILQKTHTTTIEKSH